MIILEIDREFDRFSDLLGLHPWSSFLRNPTDEEKTKVSKIFWCTFNNGRDVQKLGKTSCRGIYVSNALSIGRRQAGSALTSEKTGSRAGTRTTSSTLLSRARTSPPH